MKAATKTELSEWNLVKLIKLSLHRLFHYILNTAPFAMIRFYINLFVYQKCGQKINGIKI